VPHFHSCLILQALARVKALQTRLSTAQSSAASALALAKERAALLQSARGHSAMEIDEPSGFEVPSAPTVRSPSPSDPLFIPPRQVDGEFREGWDPLF
jgi:hypothetical protein